jgi:hypothetical protein
MEQKKIDDGTPPLWRLALTWIGGFAFLVLIALLMLWVGSLI